ncbi:pyruvate dehydrogenase complex dihydrolipoamide acetyltransferase [Balneolales bacterium ANBcel1]|nr:pyruvate dehydrogenase complex dihydrolipoamide acetyltransferase [Balneolales bacterium ANBcel1]
MATIIDMPKLSDTMEEGTIAKWNIKEGDKVEAGDIVAEVETDKATMDLEAFDPGTVLKILVEEGDSAPLGAKLVILGEEGEDISDLEGDGASAKESDGDKKEEKKPSEDKDESEEEESSEDTSEEADEKGADQKSDDGGRVKASPLAKKMAEEKGIDLSKVEGSGPQGRVIKADIENYKGEAAPAAAEKKDAADAKPEKSDAKEEKAEAPKPSVSGTSMREDEDLKVSQMRKTIAKRLAESKFTSPHFYETIDIDMKKAMAVRASLNEISDVKISFNDLVVKACAVALRRHPWLNASWKGDVVRLNGDVNIAIAVAVDEGLLTPVIRHTDQKGLRDISIETKDFAARARDKKLQPQDWEGSTFTISNLGMFGIEEFTAIINPPNAAILAVGAIRDVPVVEDGQVVPGKRMKVTLSSDHRVVDGAKAAEFLNTVRKLLEDPASMLL